MTSYRRGLVYERGPVGTGDVYLDPASRWCGGRGGCSRHWPGPEARQPCRRLDNFSWEPTQTNFGRRARHPPCASCPSSQSRESDSKRRDKKIRVTGDVTGLIFCFRSRGNGAGRGRNKARSQPPCPCHCNHPTSRRVTHAHAPSCSTPSSDVALVRIYSTPAFLSLLLVLAPGRGL